MDEMRTLVDELGLIPKVDSLVMDILSIPDNKISQESVIENIEGRIGTMDGMLMGILIDAVELNNNDFIGSPTHNYGIPPEETVNLIVQRRHRLTRLKKLFGE